MRKPLLSLVFISSNALANVSPPPVSPAVSELSLQMAQALETNDVRSYEAHLAADLKVWQEENLIASSKDEWMEKFGPKLATNGVNYSIQRSLGGALNFIHIMLFNSQGSFPPPRQECCEWFEVVKYEVRNGTIVSIQILRTGNHDLNL